MSDKFGGPLKWDYNNGGGGNTNPNHPPGVVQCIWHALHEILVFTLERYGFDRGTCNWLDGHTHELSLGS